MPPTTVAGPAVIDLSLDTDDERSNRKPVRSVFDNLSDPIEELDKVFLPRTSKRRRVNDEAISTDLGLREATAVDATVLKAVQTVSTRARTQRATHGDEISSPPAPATKRAGASEWVETSQLYSKELSESEVNDPIRTHLSAATTALLSEISGNAKSRSGAGQSQRYKPTAGSAARAQKDAQPQPRNKGLSNEEAAREKEIRNQAKEAEAQRKRLAREQKAQERQRAADFAKANQASRWDKKNTTANMIVEFSTSMSRMPLGEKAKEKLAELQSEVRSVERTVGNIVTWRRRVDTTFNEESGHWELAEESIVEESQVLCYFAGEDMCQILFNGTGTTELDDYMAKVKTVFGDRRYLVILEGVDASLRKYKNSNSKAYRNAVRLGTAIPSAAEPSSQSLNDMSEAVEENLTQLQIAHNCGVLQTHDSNDTAEWLVTLTEQISVASNRIERDNLEADLCMEIGQVSSGDDAKDTFIKMLQQVVRLTAPIAYGIVAHYPDVPSLIDAFETGGALVLQDIKKCANSDGMTTEARIGPQISRRLAQIFLETDPDVTEL